VIDIIDREAFRSHFNTVHQGLGDADSQLWAPEIWEPGARPSQWFVYVETGDWDKGEFWSWVRDNCEGSVLCYSSSEAGAWWGFERREDILMWVMRWAK
jgi:hypothetical protein